MFTSIVPDMGEDCKGFKNRKKTCGNVKSISKQFTCCSYMYVGHPISSDNDLISQKLLLKSEFYYPLHVAMGVAYSCLKYGVFIIT